MGAHMRDLQVSRRGRVPTWFVLLLGAGALFVGVELLVERQFAEGYSLVDTGRAQIVCEDAEPCAPAEWSELIAARLSELGPLDANDSRSVEDVKGVLDELSIFRSVSAPRVLWPDGIEVDVRLRKAAACVQFEGGFRSISRDGVVLPGFSVAQPLDEIALLPLIAIGEEVRHLMTGDVLPRDQDFDALSVAVSMQDHLSPEHRARMGEVLIEPQAPGETSVSGAEVSLKIQGSRGVLFGRPPIAGHAGELPEEKKWGHLAEYLDDYPTSERDWAVLDVRWDVPEVTWKQ